MTKVLHVLLNDDGGGNAYAFASKAIAGADVWLTADVFFVNLPGSGDDTYDFMHVETDVFFDGEGVFVRNVAGTPKWTTEFGDGPKGVVATGQWYRVSLRRKPGNPALGNLFVDGADQGMVNSTELEEPNAAAYFGLMGSNGWEAPMEMYIANMRVGSTRGASDIWDPDFDTDGMAVFDSVFTDDGDLGAVEAIDDPTGTVPSGDPPPRSFLPSFAIRIREHDGTLVTTLKPIGGTLEWTYRLAQVGGPGEAAWAVALSDAALGTDDFAPKRTDYELVMDDDEVLQAGIQGPVYAGSEAGSGLFGQVRAQGLDWLRYLEQPFGFDYASVAEDQADNQLTNLQNLGRIWNGGDGDDVPGVTYNATQQTVVQDLLESLAGYEDAPIFTPSFEGDSDSWDRPVDKTLMFSDGELVLGMIVALASLGEPYGFDMWCEPDKTIRLAAPRLVQPADAEALYTLNHVMVSPPLDWTNNGPQATDTVALGDGTGNTPATGFSTYQPSRDMYRRWVEQERVAFPGHVAVARAADSIGYQSRFPHKDLRVRIRPDLLDPDDNRAGFRCFLGRMVAITYVIQGTTEDDPYHTIDAFFWVTEQRYSQPDTVNWICDLSLSQVYGTDDDADPSP